MTPYTIGKTSLKLLVIWKRLKIHNSVICPKLWGMKMKTSNTLKFRLVLLVIRFHIPPDFLMFFNDPGAGAG